MEQYKRTMYIMVDVCKQTFANENSLLFENKLIRCMENVGWCERHAFVCVCV